MLNSFSLVIMESSKNPTESQCDLFSQWRLLLRVTDIHHYHCISTMCLTVGVPLTKGHTRCE